MGSNLSSEYGTPSSMIWQAVRHLENAGLAVSRISRLYRTPAFPAGAGPDFVNAAVLAHGAQAPEAILQMAMDCEQAFGRERTKRWGARTLDVDVIAVGERVFPNRGVFDYWKALAPELQAVQVPEGLVLPHPRMHERAFVLVPLLDVAPQWHHPVLGKTVREMARALPAGELAAIEPLENC